MLFIVCDTPTINFNHGGKMNKPITIKEACEFFNCSRSKINKQINMGAPIIQPAGKHSSILIDTEDWMLWMKDETKRRKE